MHVLNHSPAITRAEVGISDLNGNFLGTPRAKFLGEDFQPLQRPSVKSGHFPSHSVVAETVQSVGGDFHLQHPIVTRCHKRLHVQTDHRQVSLELAGLGGNLHEFLEPIERDLH